ncbi:MAG: putative glycosyl transferase [Methanomassiliicoccales archaeon PtaU1.Bin124]|nr:MAG: putative glycosyl transferase [Methanomassiliicoccales archaeon PtaU1.Bin124]
MEEPELTIGIATYNGERFLEAVLESIMLEARGKPIEVLISDNASTDRTAEIARSFQSRYPGQVRHYRNASNIEFDGNVDNVVRQAKGRFVWTMADDDFLLPGAADKVLSVIRSEPDLAIIFANFTNPITLKAKENALCQDGNAFFRTVQFKNGLLSCNIFNRSVWLDLDMKRYDGCLWIHMAYAMEALAPKLGRKGYVFTDLLIRQDGVARWGHGGKFIYTGLRLVEVFQKMRELGYDKDVCRMGARVIEGGYKESIPRAKANGLEVDSALLRRMFPLYRQLPSFWIWDVPMLLLPNSFFRIGFQAGRRIKYGCPDNEGAKSSG